jgi:hypothetical protein
MCAAIPRGVAPPRLAGLTASDVGQPWPAVARLPHFGGAPERLARSKRLSEHHFGGGITLAWILDPME